MCSETGPCPICKLEARFTVIEFDSRKIRVDCAGKCGRFDAPKSRLDDALHDQIGATAVPRDILAP